MRPFQNYTLLALVGGLGLLAGYKCPRPAAEVQPFNGKDLDGWYLVANPLPDQCAWRVGEAEVDPDNSRLLQVTPGTGALVNTVRQGLESLDLRSVETFGDSRIELELMIPQGSNSGIYVMGEYEIQIFDSYGKAKENLEGYDMGSVFGTALPLVNASKPHGEWQKFLIEYRAPRFDAEGNKTRNARLIKVELNGQLVHQNVELSGPTPRGVTGKESPTGPLMFQGDHGPVAFRNIVVTPLPETDD